MFKVASWNFNSVFPAGSGFVKVNEFLKRFGSIPDSLELDHLTVSGDVTFGKGVILRVSRLHSIYLSISVWFLRALLS